MTGLVQKAVIYRVKDNVQLPLEQVTIELIITIVSLFSVSKIMN